MDNANFTEDPWIYGFALVQPNFYILPVSESQAKF